MHIGLIGGIGPAATEFYYKGLVKAFGSTRQRLELTIVHAQASDLLRNLSNGAVWEQAEIFLTFVKRLEAAGADAVVVTSLAGHFCMKELEAISPLPIINAIPVLDAYFGTLNINRIGLLGTRAVLESHLYGGVSSVEIVLPQGQDLDATHDNYVAIATSGQVSSEQRDFFLSLGEKICDEQNADAIVLAGTDLFLVFDGADCSYQVIDCAQIHIDALVSAAAYSD